MNLDQLDQLTGLQPPRAVENECAVLGSMILDPKVIGDCVSILGDESSFWLEKHQIIFRQLVAMYNANQTIEMPQIKQWFEDNRVLKDVGGVEYLLTLAESVPSSVSVNHYARIVYDKAVRRHMIDTMGGLIWQAYRSSDPTDVIIDQCETKVMEVSHRLANAMDRRAQKLGDIVQECYQKISDDRPDHVIPTGFYDLDGYFNGGLRAGELVIIAARTSMGKSAFAVGLAENVANQHAAAIFSFEMTKQQIGNRLMAGVSGVGLSRIISKQLEADHFNELAMAVGQLSKLKIHIDDTSAATITELRSRVRRMVHHHGVKLVIIDYLQLMEAARYRDNRQIEVSEISRGLKRLARELDISVVALSQLNREVENRTNKRPRLSDIRESGSIEQDADIIMFLYSPDYYARNEEDYIPDEQSNTVQVIVAKHRNGPTGVVKLHFDRETCRFGNLAGQGSYV